MVAGDRHRGHTMPPARGGGGNRDSTDLRVRGELWAATVELGLVGGDGL